MCTRAIWLEDGQIQAEGDMGHIIEQYIAQVLATDGDILRQAEAARQSITRGTRAGAPGSDADGAWRWGSREAEITCVKLLDAQGRERRSFRTGETLIVRIHFDAKERIEEPQFGLALYHASGFHINGPNTVFSGLEIGAIDGQGYIDHVVNHLPLLEGTYLVSVSLYDHQGIHAFDYHHQAYTFRVRRSSTVSERYGSFLIASSWRPGPTGFVGWPQTQGDAP
jgi:hypothetical protein